MTNLIINDVSEHQGRIDWPAHRSGRQAVILRAHNGLRPDTLFGENRAGARPLRAVGIYQYLVESRDPVVQARELVATVGRLNPNEWPILDIEEGTDFAARARAWLAVVEPALGRRAWVYSGDNRWQTTDLAKAVGDRCRWVARYSSKEPFTRPYTLWQRSSDARAPGVQTAADESVFPGSIDQLIALATGDTDDMPYTPDQLREFAADGFAAALVRRYDAGAATPREALAMLPGIAKKVGAPVELDPAEFAAELAKHLPQVTAAQIAEALSKVTVTTTVEAKP